MNKKSIILSISSFLVSISGAFASNLFIAAPGYSSLVDVPEQNEPCVYRRDCEGGQFVCTANFMIGSTTYINYPVYGLDLPNDPTDCAVPLSKSVQ